MKKIKDHKCGSCEKNFGRKSHLEIHFRTIHENIKAYKCESCEKRFGQKCFLKRHIKVVHENIKD